MVRRFFLAAVLLIIMVAPLPAQQTSTWRFNWKPGQTLTYRVEKTTSITEEIEGNKTTIGSKLTSMKRWQVLEVNSAGVAVVQLTMMALRQESTTPKGDVLLYDSANPDKSNPQMREQLSKYVGKPLALLRVDAQGKLVEVKECKFGTPSRFEAEPPFVIVLPDEGPQQGQKWDRAYKVTLEPPFGTGDKYDAQQQYVCNNIQGVAGIMTFTTTIKKLPENLMDQIPLLEAQPDGEVVFDVRTGRLYSANLRVEKELKNHHGEGSSFRFQSTATEQLVGN